MLNIVFVEIFFKLSIFKQNAMISTFQLSTFLFSSNIYGVLYTSIIILRWSMFTFFGLIFHGFALETRITPTELSGKTTEINTTYV